MSGSRWKERTQNELQAGARGEPLTNGQGLIGPGSAVRGTVAHGYATTFCLQKDGGSLSPLDKYLT